MKRVLQVLRRTRELIANEANWCIGAWAREKDGTSTGADDDDACRWCLVGATKKAITELRIERDAEFHSISVDVRDVLRKTVTEMGVIVDGMTVHRVLTFNDLCGHGKTLELLGRTIERLAA